MRRLAPFSRHQAFQDFPDIYIAGARFYAAAAARARDIVKHFRKEFELLIEPVAQALMEISSRIMVSGHSGERVIQASVP